LWSRVSYIEFVTEERVKIFPGSARKISSRKSGNETAFTASLAAIAV
jgi:hypothetical protein